jgi:hypothetical protein
MRPMLEFKKSDQTKQSSTFHQKIERIEPNKKLTNIFSYYKKSQTPF